MNLREKRLPSTLLFVALIVSACGGTETTSTTTSDASAGAPGSGGNTGTAGDMTGSGGTATGTGGVDMTGSGGSTGTGGSPDGGSCVPACTTYQACCAGKCVKLVNDPMNCGGCAVQCKGATPFCEEGMCKAAPCEKEAGACGNGSCCGSNCCTSGELCCETQGPIPSGPTCFKPTADAPTCPQGCAPLCISDRSLKRDIEPIDPFAVLDTVSRLPISTWSYKSDPTGVRHMGPMAQDFKAAFGLGDTDRGYYSVDAHGVSIAAIQALYELGQEQSHRIDRLEKENEVLRRQVEILDAKAGPVPHVR